MDDVFFQERGAYRPAGRSVELGSGSTGAAAGWLRLPVGRCALAIAVGKGARYAALLWLLS